MKNVKKFAIVLSLSALLGISVNAQTKKINTTSSTVKWTGKKITGQHVGTIDLSSGSLIFKDDFLKGGTFTVNMKSLQATDLEGDYKKQFEGHLKSEDFLGVDKYETATLVFKKIKTKSKQNYMVTGDLTIKGITKSITFNLLVSSNFAKTTVVVDRTNYNIKYGSGSFFAGLGDKAISDEFNLDVSLNW
tara:strand:- start:36243 stop:36812 length:570 start_codon:yes stop_codon:yes gene_type:complete